DDGAIYSVDSAEASLNAHMLPRSAQRFVVADSSKFGMMATYRVSPLNAATRVITDSNLSPEWRRRLVDSGIAVTIVEPNGGTP
ncbi:MAG: DeoR family transcriptional regulator, partial [Devosia sp.]